MANATARVTNTGEIIFDGTRFPLVGRVRTGLISVLPAKVTIGDYSLADDQVASNWVMNDWRGGPLIEEMDESIHGNRYWWSECDPRWKGHLRLPPAATSVTTPGSVEAPSITNADMELDANWTGGARNDDQKHAGTYSWRVEDDHEAYQDLTWSSAYQGRRFTFTCYVYSGENAPARIGINDGVSTTYSDANDGDNDWDQETVSMCLSPSATRLRLILDVPSDGGSEYGYFDDAAITAENGGDTITKIIPFNSKLYAIGGKVLSKLDADGDEFVAVAEFDSDITDAYQAVNDVMVICLGTSDNYQYMSTAEAVTDTDEADGYYGCHWSDKAWLMEANGQIKYDDTPNAASPSFTNNGKLDFLDSGETQGVLVSKDADSVEIIYAVTQRGLYAHDYANARFLQTALTYPKHSYAGLGHCAWHDAIFVSSGLGVFKYTAGSTAQIQEIGLDNGDGLPAEYDGEITKLQSAHGNLCASVDSSLVSGTGYSTLWDYDDSAWWCLWVDSNADKTLYDLGVSSVYAYRRWFVADGTVKYISLYRGNKNPRLISGYANATSANHYTCVFDANWIGGKLSLSLGLFCNDMSSTETITVYYRTDDDITSTLSANWNLLGSIDSDGEHSLSFGNNSEGVEFKKIQLKFALASGSASASPDLEWAKLRYLKFTNKKWGWTCRVNLGTEYKGNSPAELKAKIEELANPGKLAEFSYRDSVSGKHTYMARLANCSGSEATGRNYKGTFELSLVAP